MNRMVRPTIVDILQDEFQNFSPKLYPIIKGDHHEYKNLDDLEYALAFSAGGFGSILFKWLEDGATKSYI